MRFLKKPIQFIWQLLFLKLLYIVILSAYNLKKMSKNLTRLVSIKKQTFSCLRKLGGTTV